MRLRDRGGAGKRPTDAVLGAPWPEINIPQCVDGGLRGGEFYRGSIPDYTWRLLRRAPICAPVLRRGDCFPCRLEESLRAPRIPVHGARTFSPGVPIAPARLTRRLGVCKLSKQDDFVKPFIGVLSVLVVIAIVLFFIARSFTGVPGTGKPVSEDSRVQAAVEQRIQPLGTVNVGEAKPQQAAAQGGGGGARSGKEIVQATCSACHGSGALGAPMIGKKAQWAPRVQKGAQVLLQHATNGFKAMPPKGGNASLSEQELKNAIGYMVSQSGLKDPFGGAQAASAGGAEKGGEAQAGGEAQGGGQQAAAGGGGDLAEGKQVYSQTCFACHGTGAAGAPKIGDKSAWAPRVAKGKPTLYKHALNGFNAMPPHGGNPSLSEAQVKSAVDYLVSQAK